MLHQSEFKGTLVVEDLSTNLVLGVCKETLGTRLFARSVTAAANVTSSSEHSKIKRVLQSLARVNTSHRAQGTERREQNAEHGARSTEHGARSTEYGIRSTKHRAR